MNKQKRTRSKRKRYGLITNLFRAFLLLSLALGVNSCRKDVLVPTSIRTKDTNGNKIQNISYSQFLNKVELNSTGTLKSVLQSAVNSKSTKTNSLNSTLNYDIETTNVKELIVKDTISYVLALKPQTPHAVHFQNITIQTAKGKTIAFLSTYLPTKEWIADWKGNKRLGFKGDILINRINLGSVLANKNSSNGVKAAIPTNNINIGGNTISLAPGECEIYDLYDLIPFQCSTGDWPGACRWEQDPGAMPGDGYLPGYRLEIVGLYVNCAPPENPPPPGEGGGGNTTPNPPGGYDPCDDPPVQNSIRKGVGFNLQTVPPNPCDGNGGGGNSSATILINDLQITDEGQKAYLYSNTSDATALHNYLTTNGWTSGNMEFIYWAIAYITENPSEEVANLLANRSSLYYTNAEMEAIINSMTDPLTGNGVEFYLVVKYQGSKLFDLSRYDKVVNSVQAGSYTLTPSYSKNGTLLFYAAYRNSQNGIEYIIRANQLSSFTSNVEFYTSAANLVYFNGIPNQGTIQIMSGDRVDGLLNLWSNALRSVDYWLYLANLYFISSPSSAVRTKVINTLKKDVASGYSFTNTAAAHLDNIVTRGAYAGQLARPYMNSPLTISEIMATGSGIPDASFAGGLNWRVPGTFRGSTGTWELGINPQTKVIYHFNFTN